MVKPGGTVLLHDTVYSMQGEEGYPVARALDTFCTETGRKWVEHGGGEFGFGEIPQPNG
jgi:hypothetical protein